MRLSYNNQQSHMGPSKLKWQTHTHTHALLLDGGDNIWPMRTLKLKISHEKTQHMLLICTKTVRMGSQMCEVRKKALIIYL